MTVTSTYLLRPVSEFDPRSIGANAGAASLAGGGAALVGDHSGHTNLALYDPDGNPLASVLNISGLEAAVAQLSNGNVVVVTDNGTSASFTIRHGTTGAPVVASSPATGTYPDLCNVDVAALSGGGFVVASQPSSGGSGNDILVSVFDNAGAPVTSFGAAVSAADDQQPTVAALADGGFVVAWHRTASGESGLWYAVYNANGSVRKAPVLLDDTGTVNRNARAVALDTGGFAIAYEDDGWSLEAGGTDIDITLARFTADGTLLQRHDLSQDTLDDTLPSLTVLTNGMLLLGATTDVFSDTDVRWTLVDAGTGAVLTSDTRGKQLRRRFVDRGGGHGGCAVRRLVHAGRRRGGRVAPAAGAPLHG